VAAGVAGGKRKENTIQSRQLETEELKRLK
jgi:hypothetical protein